MLKNKLFENHVALVTGGTSGIGEATVRILSDLSATVIFTGRRADRGGAICEELRNAGLTVQFVHLDHADAGEEEASLISRIVRDWGQLDLVFNNAGTEGRWGPIDQLTDSDFDETLGLNLRSMWRLLREQIRYFRSRPGGGAIVNNSSWLGFGALEGSSIY